MLNKWLNQRAWTGLRLAMTLSFAAVIAGSSLRADAQPIPVGQIEVKERVETRILKAPAGTAPKGGTAQGQAKMASEGKDGKEVVVFTQIFVDGKLLAERVKSTTRTGPQKAPQASAKTAASPKAPRGQRGTLASRQAPRSGRTLRNQANAARRNTDRAVLEAAGFGPEFAPLAPAQIAYASMRNWSLEGGKAMTVNSTAYTPCAGLKNPTFRTATGRPARRGMIAVDPRVIPLHSLIYVEGYGWGIAADTGGAIKGAKIDVCVDEREEALQWGRRQVRIIVFPQRVTSDLPGRR